MTSLCGGLAGRKAPTALHFRRNTVTGARASTAATMPLMGTLMGGPGVKAATTGKRWYDYASSYQREGEGERRWTIVTAYWYRHWLDVLVVVLTTASNVG